MCCRELKGVLRSFNPITCIKCVGSMGRGIPPPLWETPYGQFLLFLGTAKQAPPGLSLFVLPSLVRLPSKILKIEFPTCHVTAVVVKQVYLYTDECVYYMQVQTVQM